MATKLELQRQILNELNDYSDKIIYAVEEIINELRDGRNEDTDDLFNFVIQGINWVIEVFNGCEDIINNEKQLVDKAKMAQAVKRLGTVLKEKDDVKIAACLQVDFLPFLSSMQSASEMVDEICQTTIE